jgi:hypothetical protein
VSSPTTTYKKSDIVAFGDYEWRVLEVSDDKVLLLSEYVIEYKPYHNSKTDITWAQCDLRSYLNGEFLNSFSDDDKLLIAKTENTNSNNPWSGVPGGNLTDDYFFLLSVEDVLKYFGDSGELNSPNESAQYNDARKAYERDSTESEWWWLRSPGYHGDQAASIGRGGSLNGTSVSNVGGGIRPALWLNLQ